MRPRRLERRFAAAAAAVLGMLVIVAVAAAAPAGVNITAVEGQSFTGSVVTGLSCPLASATITWGDGTATSAGMSDGSMGIQGTHTYAEEGTYSGSVSYTYTSPRPCQGSTQTASFQATVQDAPLTATGIDVNGTAGQSLSAVVAHVDDANPSGSANDFSAQITWGDGSVSSGSLSAAGGGFDVTGTHTYNTAGNYPVNTSITDIGGSSTGANSAAQIAAAPPPPPPPSGPQAQFEKSPNLPCADDSVGFDASASQGSTATGLVKGHPVTFHRSITRYRWSIYDPTSVMAGNPPVPPFVATTPEFTHVFGPAYSVFGTFRGMFDVGLLPLPGTSAGSVFPGWDVRVFRPGVTMTLQVTDSAGQTASISRYFTFRNPDETVVMLFQETSYTPTYHDDVYYEPGHDANGNEVWSSDPNKNIKVVVSVEDYAHPKGSGVTDFTKPLGTVEAYGYGKGCDSHPVLPKAGVTVLKSKPAALAAQRAAFLHLYATHATVTVQHPCLYARLGCDGILEVQTVRSARRAGDLVRLAKPGAAAVGLIRFVVPAGRRNATVTIKLNALGYALARAHELRRVTLRLLAAGSTGRIALTSRTVRLLSPRRHRSRRG
jgi:hypothetical protein